MPVSFFDTNVLVYLASGDAAKADRAEAAIAAGGSISVQILNELINVARRKMKMSWDETHAFLNMLRGSADGSSTYRRSPRNRPWARRAVRPVNL